MHYMKYLPLLILITTLISPIIPLSTSDTVGIHPDFPHAKVVVTRVVDGDTIHIAPAVCVAGSYRTVVRLADIQAPDLDQPSGTGARDALIELLAQHNNTVYLDIANYSLNQGCSSGHVDDYGRIVAVIYVRIDETTLLNVNKWLIENNHANVVNYPDDFDPNKWSLYVSYHVQNEKLPTITKTTLFTGFIMNATSWGVRVATTPDRNYLGVAFSEGSPDYALNIRIINSNGDIVANHRISDSNVWRAMLDIAANETGFLVVWN